MSVILIIIWAENDEIERVSDYLKRFLGQENDDSTWHNTFEKRPYYVHCLRVKLYLGKTLISFTYLDEHPLIVLLN